jgi:hypothetical protein
MSETSVQTTPASPVAPAIAQARVQMAPRSRSVSFLRQVLLVVASLRVTVVLFLFAIVLVFFGTMGQVEEGLLTVLTRYFRTAIAWVPFQVLIRFGQVFFWFPKSWHVSGSFPFPGGWLLGGMLLVNLLAAHLVRFRLGWKRSGILLIHAGLVVMMISELATGLLAVESKMTLKRGESANFVDVSNRVELAFIDSSDPKEDHVVAIPETVLRQGGIIRDARLPCDVQVLQYAKNSNLVNPQGDTRGVLGTVIDDSGREWGLVPQGEAKGVDNAAGEDAPLVHVAFLEKDTGKVVSKRVLSLWTYRNFLIGHTGGMFEFPPQHQELAGKTYEVVLRNQRVYKPYHIRLDKFHQENYPGTNNPRTYESTVHLSDPTTGEDREVRIWMNHPLGYRLETFYQHSVLPGGKGSVLQVVRNPFWVLPYVSCIMVSVGMLIHFGLHLARFLKQRVRVAQ